MEFYFQIENCLRQKLKLCEKLAIAYYEGITKMKIEAIFFN